MSDATTTPLLTSAVASVPPAFTVGAAASAAPIAGTIVAGAATGVIAGAWHMREAAKLRELQAACPDQAVGQLLEHDAEAMEGRSVIIAIAAVCSPLAALLAVALAWLTSQRDD